MTDFIHIILEFIKDRATPEELNSIRDSVGYSKDPVIEPLVAMDRLKVNVKILNNESPNNRLRLVKFIKDTTGWGLKESKDWLDKYIPRSDRINA